MRNLDNGFAKAQREYENKMPPEENLMPCPDCDGTGKSSDGMTACCGEKFYEDLTGVCTSCGEHANVADCKRCDGSGEIDADKYKAEQREEREIDRWEENRFEQPRERFIE